MQVPGAFAVVAGVRIDTRYDKTKESYLGVVSLVSVLQWIPLSMKPSFALSLDVTLYCEPLKLADYQGSLRKDDQRICTDHLRQTGGIPIAKPDAAMALRPTDEGWFGRAVNAVVRLVEIDPDDTDRIIGARLDHGLFLGRGSIPEQIRAIMIGRQECGAFDLPVADRQRIMLASRRCRKLRDEVVFGIVDLEKACGLTTTILAPLGCCAPTLSVASVSRHCGERLLA
ncbi:hypothetical protein BSY17_3266 (plasmid) [Sphingobium sp. RAC03]|nr:hypothetical protein BSY17_3266 [Sphingobium sp. RAC03]